MNKNDFPKKINEDLEIESVNDKGTYVITYKTASGGYSKVAWTPTDGEVTGDNLDSAKVSAIEQVKKHLGL